MCRNIRMLFNFEPPATDEEIRASALQFVRKVSGYTHPSKANEVLGWAPTVSPVRALAAVHCASATRPTGAARRTRKR